MAFDLFSARRYTCVVSILERFGLSKYLHVQPTVLVTPHEEAGRFVALRTIRTADEHAALMADVVTLLHLSDEPEQAKAAQYYSGRKGPPRTRREGRRRLRGCRRCNTVLRSHPHS
jgi:hypothetical protein